MGGLGELILAAVLFVGGHFLASSPAVRRPAAGRMGERPFVGVYSLVAILLLVWMISAYARAPLVPLWQAPLWCYWLPAIFMTLACLLLVCGVSQDNPTAVMQRVREGARVAPGILAITRHPVMWAIGLWALSHIPANGTAADLILFGSLALLALAGTLAIDAKKRRQWSAEEWARLAGQTSNLPFAAILSGKARLRPGEIGGVRLLGAAALYVLLVFGHPWIAGVPAVAP